MADALVGYKEPDSPTVQLEVNDGDIGGKVPIHDVRSLPGTVETDITAIKSAVDGLETLVGATNTALSTTNSTLTTIDGRVDGLEALVGTTNTTLTTIDGRVDGVEGKLDTVNTNLDPGTCVTNQTSSTTTSAAFSSQACTLGAWVKNISTSNQVIYIKMNATATSGNSYQLTVGEERFFPCGNMNEINHIASATGANTCWEAI
jgi:hypothetical protein